MKKFLLISALLIIFNGCGSKTSFDTESDYSYDYDSESTFCDYSCTGDCSGHEAGYDWAREKGIDDPGDCGGNSQSFIEGCKAYASGC